MDRKINVLMLVFIVFLSNQLFSQEVSPIKEKIIVTASLIPVEFSRIARKVIVIKKENIEKAPVNSVTELLKYFAGIDLRERSPFGIQYQENFQLEIIKLFLGILIFSINLAE